MGENDDRASDAKTLHRMIAYLRSEALRLRIMDVAVLLEHAEDAVLDFSLAGLGERDPARCAQKGAAVEH